MKLYDSLLDSNHEDISAIVQLGEIIQEEQINLVERLKNQLIEKGYEARTIDKYVPIGLVCPNKFFISVYRVIICHKECPSFEEIRQVSKPVSSFSLIMETEDVIVTRSGFKFDKRFILGHGSEESTAWAMAVYNYWGEGQND